MENNMELFDRYVNGSLDAEQMRSFKERLESDREFAVDFRIYILSLRGMCQEAEQDNLEFGHAMKALSQEDLLQIIGRHQSAAAYKRRGISRVRERLLCACSFAAMLVVGLFAVISIDRSGRDRVDDIVVAYNSYPEASRGGEEVVASDDIPALERAYAEAPADDVQAQEDAGMRLAMAYLKAHDRKKARELLAELSLRFAHDEEFAAQCRMILGQIK